MSGTRIYRVEDFEQEQEPISVTTDKDGNMVVHGVLQRAGQKHFKGPKDPSINYEKIHEKLW